MGVLPACGEAVFEVAQFDDQALDASAQAALVEGGASRGDEGSFHGESPLQVETTAVISHSDLLQLAPISQQKQCCEASRMQQ